MGKAQNLTRRQFVAGGAGAMGAVGAMLSVPLVSSTEARGEDAAAKNEEKHCVKFSVFADIHHFPGTFYSRTPENLVVIQERAEREKCDFIIHCGDFCHHPHKETNFVNLYNDFHIPSFHTTGNHDFDGCSPEETFKAYRLEKGYYFFERNGFRFVVLDANFFRNEDGTFTHYAHGNYFQYKGNAVSILPPEEIAWLADVLENSPYPCVLFSHQSAEREVGSIANWDEIRNIIDSTNARHPGRIRMCINGHHHRDFLRILNNVVYFDLNSASYEWVEKRHDFYPPYLCKKYSLLNHTLVYEDPIHAVVTMDSEGLIKIDGTESRMFLGITTQKAGLRFADSCGRPVVPRVQSAEMRFVYPTAVSKK
ncbi:MAG: metallophosphoesterase [Planctomycetia bacterium]|nr:metallophosphoesterase [Planctomycetia bacterium]